MANKFSDVTAFLDTITDLPVLPANIDKISEIMADENAGAEEISKVIQTDQGLTTKVLKIANSAFYGRINQVVSIREAVVVIGIANIKSMLYSIFIDQLYGGGSAEDERIMIELWEHSVATALMAGKIMEQNFPGDRDAAYTGGLLHDIGELIIFKYENELFKEVLKEIAAEDQMPRVMLEETIMGFNHADLGAAIARKWNLPRQIRNSIFYHHTVVEADTDKNIVYAVHLADCICGIYGIGGTDIKLNGKSLGEVLAPGTLEALGLNNEKLSTLLLEMDGVKKSAGALMETVKGG
jgi:putative nucleotidyltransferase with HDIG domain